MGVDEVKGINWNKMVESGHSDLEDWIEPFGVVVKRPLSTCVFHFKEVGVSIPQITNTFEV